MGDIADAQRISQIGLVRAEFEHRGFIRDAHKRGAIHGAAVSEFLEKSADHRLDGGEHVFLRDVAHLEIELVEFTGRAIGAAGFVAETRRDLEVFIEAGHHQQLLKLLRRLRQRIEFAGMHARRHQEVARAFGAGSGEDRGLVFNKPLIDHAAAYRGDHLGAQNHILVHAIAPQIEITVFKAQLVRIIFPAGNLHRQYIGHRLHHDIGHLQLDLAGG